MSIPALTFSVGSIGKGWLAKFNSLISFGKTSTPFGALGASCTVPLIATTDSFLNSLNCSNMFSSTFLLGAVI